ncbi:NAD-dependent protein deacetylase sirtuin-2-like isoform X2 [Mercenaria mercenaria]|uniref:NAD-dependent protein deacetylase sirtuin-2-like isoform X1 n=1 Tax=Mercenaria mercenaria TaxID=6596 RepID=UPI00234F7072|nr:NAD-dependent protein deacetylase sirtuin-2-like isoform X1 [Mercenaria mercenaria]XP_053394180.1 NAD-dependent protein deacetylase sirtuin-2-like isoform X2 [Mercenaria mercenaria]
MATGGKYSDGENKQTAGRRSEPDVTTVNNAETDKTEDRDGVTQTFTNGTNTDEDGTKEAVNETGGGSAVSDDPQMVWLRRYFAKSLGICFEEPPECLLEEVSFEGIARYIASDKCSKIVVMTGAGISTSAGIPDFRSPGTGCYEQLKKEYNIENPQQLFEYSYFKDNPEPYYKYRKELWRCTYKVCQYDGAHIRYVCMTVHI